MEQIADNVYLETNYDGVTVAAVRTHEGVICIDVPSYPRQARDWVTRLHTLHSRAVRYAVLTDMHGDRLLNVRWLNAPIIAHQKTAEQLQLYDKRFPQALIESLVSRNPERSRDFRNSPVPQPTLHFSNDMRIQKGNLDLHFMSKPGPTAGSIWVHLPRANVLFVGDTVPIEIPPLMQLADSHQWLQRLEELRPWLAENQIISGRGGRVEIAHIDAARDYIQAMQTQVETHIAEEKIREQVTLYAKQYISRYPRLTVPPEWLRGQIKHSLEHVYDEIQLHQTKEDPQADLN
jgi:glyoxylase-like metal-dependent hydrolase (beta-lactamase superfamily II)